MNKFSKLEHTRISNPGDGFQNTSPAVWSLCFSQKSELVDYLAWVHVQLYDSFYFSTQKSKFLNKYQIFLRELDENSWKLDVQISDHRVSCSFLSCFFSLLSFLWKHLQTAMRYGHTPFKSPFIFHSASILRISHVFIFFYIIFSWIFLEFWNRITSFVCQRQMARLIWICILKGTRKNCGRCLVIILCTVWNNEVVKLK